MKPLRCYAESQVAVDQSGCTSDVALWEVIAPTFPVGLFMSVYQKLYLHATCSESNMKLRAKRIVSIIKSFQIVT